MTHIELGLHKGIADARTPFTETTFERYKRLYECHSKGNKFEQLLQAEGIKERLELDNFPPDSQSLYAVDVLGVYFHKIFLKEEARIDLHPYDKAAEDDDDMEADCMWFYFCSPLRIAAITISSQGEHGRILALKAEGSDKTVILHIPLYLLASDGRKLCEILFSFGLTLFNHRNAFQHLQTYIMEAEDAPVIYMD